MTNRVADDFAAIRKRLDELTREELKQVQSDTGDEHTIAVQPSTGKRYKWINGSWTEEEFTLTGFGPIDHEPSKYWRILEGGKVIHDPNYDTMQEKKMDQQAAHTLLDYMI